MRSVSTLLSIAAIASATAAVPAVAQAATQAAAQPASDTTPTITWGGFVDAYYAWDTGKPLSRDRSFAGGTLFTTQPARHNEFNVNLAFLEARLTAPTYRGRLALQTGTSVQSNYSGEPSIGQISGPSLARFVQEATAGVKVAEHVWVDAGVFYSHVGMESWASRDNITYTRSLVADYSPYYQSGVRLTWTPTAKLTAQVNLVNGWQIISENNNGKGAGVRIDYAVRPDASLSYYNLVSQEAGTRLRTFQGVGSKITRAGWTVIGNVDVGTQSRGKDAGDATWWGWTLMTQKRVTHHTALVARVEGYRDPEQIILSTGTRASGSSPVANDPFRAAGVSFGIDVTPTPRVQWRTELRGWSNDRAIFPDGAASAPIKRSLVAVTALTLSL
jgi:hypothetical protein